MTDFELFALDHYQRVPASLDAPKATELIYSDIVSHLPTLEFFASLCQHVTEFGVRDGSSTTALLKGCRGQVHSYDIEKTSVVERLRNMLLPCEWHFHQGDTAKMEPIEKTELLFIDTLHTFEHVLRELQIHGRRAKRFLAFHDTFTCGQYDLSGPDRNARGILPAIELFLSSYPEEYRTVYRTDACNGLWILARVS